MWNKQTQTDTLVSGRNALVETDLRTMLRIVGPWRRSALSERSWFYYYQVVLFCIIFHNSHWFLPLFIYSYFYYNYEVDINILSLILHSCLFSCEVLLLFVVIGN